MHNLRMVLTNRSHCDFESCLAKDDEEDEEDEEDESREGARGSVRT